MGLRAFYDAGALIAAERNERKMWVLHRAQLMHGLRPLTSAPVVAQVSRHQRQASLHRLLKACEVAEFEAAQSGDVGRLLAMSGTSDVVDAHVVVIGQQHRTTIVTTDLDDIRHLSASSTFAVPVRGIER